MHPIRFGKGIMRKAANAIEPPAVVLLYHRVARIEGDEQMLCVGPDNFRAQIRWLKENFDVIRFEDSLRRAQRPSVAITFDDGYADNLHNALPVLEDIKAHAAFFVTAGSIGAQREFWWDEVQGIILKQEALPKTFDLAIGGNIRAWPAENAVDRKAFYQGLLLMLKSMDAEKRDECLNRLRQWAGTGPVFRESMRPMTVDELKRLSGSPFATIGSHGMTHTALSALSRGAQARELNESRKALEAWIEREVSTFSYPFGTRLDFTKETALLCRDAGYGKAAANFPGQAHSWTDAFQVPRHIVRDWPFPEFKERLKAFFG
jgi:peptidoglycan/xylan/chitin deacetylase (PgdA/CDA1 family)